MLPRLNYSYLLLAVAAVLVFDVCWTKQSLFAQGPATQAQAKVTALSVDRTVLPISEPKIPHSTVLDARNAKAPTRFAVKAPAKAPNVLIVLIDREHGAVERLRRHGYNLISILKLDVMLNHYMSRGLISEETYRICADYLRSKQAENRMQ